jgi:nucleoside-diphosphate-sugar epimerase
MVNQRILIAGNLGYIGPEAVKVLKKRNPGYRITGFDLGYFVQNTTTLLPTGETLLDCQYYGDVRQFDEKLLKDIDAVIYLAAISNDPMGTAYEKPTMEINCDAAVEMARKAKKMNVKRFVFASSCSVYGFADSAPRTESSQTNPLTAYAKSKIAGEEGLAPLADDNFQVTCLRYATACGFSDRLRLDLVLNDFVASAIVEKRINILSDGTPWRPLIHVKDMSLAMDWAINRTVGDPFLIINTGSNSWNYQVKELAEAVRESFGNVEVQINPNAAPDKRSYKVDFSLYEKLAPEHQPRIDLKEAIDGLRKGLTAIGFNDPAFRQSPLIRLKTLQKLIADGEIDENLARRNRSLAFN